MNLELARQLASQLVDALKEAVVTPAGVTTTVQPGDDLQAAINAANPGDTIQLVPGGRYVGNFVLPVKTGPVKLTTAGVLPNRQVQPGDVFGVIVCQNPDKTIDGTGATNWILDGLQFEGRTDGLGEVIAFQDAAHITLDRLLIVGGANGMKRGIRGNADDIKLTRSYIANIWRDGQDSQAYCSWEGNGQLVDNNYLEAASENLMIGGSDSSAAEKMPQNITISNNTFYKPAAWVGTGKAIKNLLELKCGKNILIENNHFSGNWTDAQSGWGIVLKVANQDGGNPWNVLEDVIFRNNTLTDSDHGINILGNDYGQPSGRLTRMVIQNNNITVRGQVFQAGGEVGVLTIDGNIAQHGYNLFSLYKGDVWNAGTPATRPGLFAVENLTFTNNQAQPVEYGIKGEGCAPGNPSLVAMCPTFVYTGNTGVYAG